MLHTRLTKLGKMFLLLMLLFYGAAVTSQSGLLLLLIGLIGGCFAVNWTFSRRNVRNLNLAAPKNVSLVEGSSLAEPWTLENHSTKHIEMVEARDESELLFRVPLVEVDSVIAVTPRLRYQRRGVYPNSRVTITSAAPYGLLRSGRTLNLPGEVVVFPRVYEAFSPAVAGFETISGGRFRGARRINSGAHFAGVRTWQAGDSLKQVHWKTSARRGELMVKQFEEELAGRISVLLDCEPGAGPFVDEAVRAAASLGATALMDGHHVELITSNNSGALRLPPFGDETELLDRLARYNAAEPLGEFDLATLWRKSVLAIVGTRFRVEWMPLLEQAERQNRPVHLYLRETTDVPDLSAEIWEFSADAIYPATRKELAHR
jgi:uncharacterized protein (DUF58 family)